MTRQTDQLQQVLGLNGLHRVKQIVQRSTSNEVLTKPFSRPGEKRAKPNRCKVRVVGVLRPMGNVMMAVLAIAVMVEIAILVTEIATRARSLAQSLSSSRARA